MPTIPFAWRAMLRIESCRADWPRVVRQRKRRMAAGRKDLDNTSFRCMGLNVGNNFTIFMAIMTQPTPSQRLYSLDALRGFDMFWIAGGEEIFHSLAKITGNSFWQTLSDQFEHPAWNGFHFYDLIFPLFLFIAGVATPYSVGKELEKGTSRQQLLWRVVRRGLILVLLGIYYNNGAKIHPWADIRYGSVLGRIGLAYMFANIIYLYTKQRGQTIWFA